jgi:hypothetical protein
MDLKAWTLALGLAELGEISRRPSLDITGESADPWARAKREQEPTERVTALSPPF